MQQSGYLISSIYIYTQLCYIIYLSQFNLMFPFPLSNFQMECWKRNLTVVVIPPTNILFGITVPYFGAWVLIGVPTGVGHGETSEEDCKK